MTYTAFDPTLPDPASQNITNFGGSARTNFKALRDAIVAGNLPGYNYSWSGGTIDQPTIMYRVKGSEVIRATVASGDGNGNPTAITYAYSSTGTGGSYTTIGTITFSWDGNGFLNSSTWS